MADSYLIKIKPTITAEDGRKMENDLNSRFKRVAKKFGGALRTVGGALKGLLTGAAVAMIANPIEKLNEKLNSTLSYADQITTRAEAIGTSAGRLAQVETVAKSAGVSNIDQILTKFQTGLARARLGEDKTLTQFTKYDDTLTAFLNAIKSIQGIKNVNERTFAVQKIFGEENAAKMSELIAIDFSERWGQIFGNMDVGKIRKAASPFVVNVGGKAQAQASEKGREIGFEGLAEEFDLIFDRLGGLEDQQAVKSQRRMFEDFITKSETITGKLIEAQDATERRRLETENVQMKSFEKFAKMAEEAEKTKTILAEIQQALVPTIVRGVEAIDGLYQFVKTKGRVFGRKN